MEGEMEMEMRREKKQRRKGKESTKSRGRRGLLQYALVETRRYFKKSRLKK